MKNQNTRAPFLRCFLAFAIFAAAVLLLTGSDIYAADAETPEEKQTAVAVQEQSEELTAAAPEQSEEPVTVTADVTSEQTTIAAGEEAAAEDDAAANTEETPAVSEDDAAAETEETPAASEDDAAANTEETPAVSEDDAAAETEETPAAAEDDAAADTEETPAAAEDDAVTNTEGTPVLAAAEAVEDPGVDIYRLYNSVVREHFYTSNYYERDVCMKNGWRYEGIGWTAPTTSNTPIYRLYNPAIRAHHYTIDKNERDTLRKYGWIYEEIVCYSDDAKQTAVWREYNPSILRHNFTTNRYEHDYLTTVGWKGEGVAWYGIPDPNPVPDHPVTVYAGYDVGSVYDFNDYESRYADIQSVYGNNDVGALEHFIAFGLVEGRQAKDGVSPSGSAYRNVKELFHPTMSDADRAVESLIRRSRTSKKTSEIILVLSDQISFWQKNAVGRWTKQYQARCGHGTNGFSSNHREGDRTTPIGSYPILFSFGSGSNPGSAMTWRQITVNSYWSGERATYNTWVESSRKIKGEHLCDYYQYKYAMAIGYNVNPAVYGRGSAIFLHCKSRNSYSTAGCVSTTESAMVWLLRHAGNGTYIMITPNQSRIAGF